MRAQPALAAAAVALLPSPAFAACTLSRIAELPVTLLRQEALIDARFGGHPARFVLDSGAAISLLPRATAIELGLKIRPAPTEIRIGGTNGDASAAVAIATDFTLAGIALPNKVFVIGGSDMGATGLIGRDVLDLADSEYDLPHAAVRLIRPAGCEADALAYRAGARSIARLPMERDQDDRGDAPAIVPVVVNGVTLRALLDLGASSTTMTLAAARRLHLTPSSPGVREIGYSSGIGAKRNLIWSAPLNRLDIGGETFLHPRIDIEKATIDTDMLLGFDFFLTHRVYISNRQHVVYATYEGGSFLGVTPAGVVPGMSAISPPSAGAISPVDAAALGRRGAAAIATGHYEEGLADVSRAVAADPASGDLLLLRAELKLAHQDAVGAQRDLDAAASLMPDDPRVRLLRARLRLAGRDRGDALDDIAEAERTLPTTSNDRLRLANLDMRAGKPAQAIGNFDAWIAAHPDDADRPSALYGRCAARLRLRIELPRALSDCSAAAKLQPTSTLYLSSRAVAHDRLGRTKEALADFAATMAIDPHDAFAFLGRAMTEARVGNTAAAEADRKTAIELDQGIVRHFTARYGR